MITLQIEVPYASFRKSYARSYAETYPLPPPATIYGMLLSLVGERFRHRHEGVQLAFAFKKLPDIATTLRKLSRYKYGVSAKQSTFGNAPDFVETLCGIELLCWVDSSQEQNHGISFESRIISAVEYPEKIERYGLLSLGLSDDAVNDLSICKDLSGQWCRLLPSDSGLMELPVWVDHLGSVMTRWQRYSLDQFPIQISTPPDGVEWQWTKITKPLLAH